MIFYLQDGAPWVRFQARSPRGKYTSFIAPLAELRAYAAQAFFLMHTLG